MKTLSLTQIEELFKILQKNKCEYTINNNGIFLNLSWLESATLDQIELFINFCCESKKELDKYEQICRDLNDDMDVRREGGGVCAVSQEEIEEKVVEEAETIEVAKKMVPKVSSSMRFYLLKKKFSKSNQSLLLQHLKERELSKEPPLIASK